MKNINLDKSLFAIALVSLTACASHNYNDLTEAHARLSEVRSNSTVMSQAPLLVQKASDTIQRAEMAADKRDSDEVHSLAYIAQRQLDSAVEKATEEVARAQTDTASKIAQSRVKSAETRAMVNEVIANQYHQQAIEATQEVRLLQSELATFKTIPTQRGLELSLGADVLFETDRAEIKPGARRQLQPMTQFLERHLDKNIIVEGHTDNSGSPSHNQVLSLARAQSVKDYFTASGVDAQRITVRGMSQDFPIATNNTAAGQQLNRRVDLIITSGN